MFRTTFVTGSVLYAGTKARDVTAYIDPDTNEVEYRTPKGAVIKITKDTMWKTLRGTRVAAKAKAHQDGRFSGNGPTMFAVPMNNITATNGKVMGRTENTERFILHMLAVSGDKTAYGQTKADRQNDAAVLLSKLAVA